MNRFNLIPVIFILPLTACAKILNSSLPPLSIQTPTSTSYLAPTQAGSPVIARLEFPSLVWLPFEQSSASHEGKVLTVRSGQGSFEKTPVEIGAFWEYTSLTGRIVYGSQPKHDGGYPSAVTDLWVYDYSTGQAEMWWEDGVVGAAWAPVVDPGSSHQYLAAGINGGEILAIFTGPFENEYLAERPSGNFSWSPDGRSLAYESSGSIYIASLDGSQPRRLTNVTFDPDFGWIGDKPVWIEEQQSLVYPTDTGSPPFVIVPLDNSQTFTPLTAEGNPPEGGRAFNMLWAPEKRILVTETEDMHNSMIWIYEFSADLHVISSISSFPRNESNPLASWWIPGESILLRNGEVWSLAENRIVLTIR